MSNQKPDTDLRQVVLNTVQEIAAGIIDEEVDAAIQRIRQRVAIAFMERVDGVITYDVPHARFNIEVQISEVANAMRPPEKRTL